MIYSQDGMAVKIIRHDAEKGLVDYVDAEDPAHQNLYCSHISEMKSDEGIAEIMEVIEKL